MVELTDLGAVRVSADGPPSRRPNRGGPKAGRVGAPRRISRILRVRPRAYRVLTGTALASLLISPAACAAAPAPPPSRPPANNPAAATSAVRPLPVNGRLDYQIGGPYPPAASVAVVSRDRREDSVPGRYNICYLNAFQTQPEEADFWTRQHPTRLVRKGGRLVTDPDWPGKYLLDTSTASKRTALAKIESGWVAGCARSGYQAVELDNLDSWVRSKKVLDQSDNLAFAALLTQQAHAAGLAVAQKNTSEIGSTGARRVGFDFAIAEECQLYDECDDYTAVYGRRVLEIEYTDNPRTAFTRACAARGQSIAVTLRDRGVVPRGRKGYHYQSC